ncbi:MAG: four helix bundle protein [Pirellulales bacterium]|nr:four helix bundle protein [Pirellulales bacterium]
MQDFHDLKVWHKARALAREVYEATRGFPKDELFGLTSQMRRSVISVGANIAEGCGREGDTELKRFLQIAMGSASELEHHIILSGDLGFLTEPDHQRLMNSTIELKRMLASLIRALRTTVQNSR